MKHVAWHLFFNMLIIGNVTYSFCTLKKILIIISLTSLRLSVLTKRECEAMYILKLVQLSHSTTTYISNIYFKIYFKFVIMQTEQKAN